MDKCLFVMDGIDGFLKQKKSWLWCPIWGIHALYSHHSSCGGLLPLCSKGGECPLEATGAVSSHWEYFQNPTFSGFVWCINPVVSKCGRLRFGWWRTLLIYRHLLLWHTSPCIFLDAFWLLCFGTSENECSCPPPLAKGTTTPGLVSFRSCWY